jgi:small subunit ribosomal protein S16
MALKIRLARIGTRHLPVYRVVVAEARSRRDGAAVEQIGTYHPKQSDVALKLNLDRVDYWVKHGAVPTSTVHSLIKKARHAAPAATTAAD